MSVATLRVERVSRAFGDILALRDVTLEARAGEVLAILGASGSGKSTLVRLMALVDEPTSGRVLLDGVEVPWRGPRWLDAVRRLGLVQQKPGLLRASTLANVAFPLRARGVRRPSAERTARTWLDRLGLAARADARAWTLSGGEAQRAALARALVARPDALLLDEATNQLDPESTRVVEDILREQAARGASVVLVTHSVAQARRIADRIAFFDAGTLAAQGVSHILDDPPTSPLARFLAFA